VAHFYSAVDTGQDRFLYDKFFQGKRDGVFVEIGGYNGWMGSNCYFFEKNMGWRGVVVEASARLARQTAEVRSNPVVHAAIADRDGTMEFLEITAGLTQMSGLADHYVPKTLELVRRNPAHAETATMVPSMRLETLLRTHDLEHVDYCSIDVEGAERAILSSFDFAAFDISVLSAENNQSDGSGSVRDIMEAAGYELVEIIGADEIYRKRNATP
jgi:FkbM family methyltransferase